MFVEVEGRHFMVGGRLRRRTEVQEVAEYVLIAGDHVGEVL